MRTKQRLSEVIDTLNADAVGPASVLVLSYALDAITGHDLRVVLENAVARLAEASPSPHVAELAAEVLVYMREQA